ncbi:hypothetical protein B0H19DRAFT_1084196 [Mycena capillaripes]|nr:hypothetical protein B0H19DRAFT_1084196 [Mycena capillaripes]
MSPSVRTQGYLPRGADVNQTGRHGKALHAALQMGRERIARWLNNYGILRTTAITTEYLRLRCAAAATTVQPRRKAATRCAKSGSGAESRREPLQWPNERTKTQPMARGLSADDKSAVQVELSTSAHNAQWVARVKRTRPDCRHDPIILLLVSKLRAAFWSLRVACHGVTREAVFGIQRLCC